MAMFTWGLLLLGILTQPVSPLRRAKEASDAFDGAAADGIVTSADGTDPKQPLDDAPEDDEIDDTPDGGEVSPTIIRRRRRRRDRRRDRRRRDRRRRYAPCDGVAVFPTPESVSSVCCGVRVQGQWSFVRSIAMTETVNVSYGFYSNVQTFDLDATYRSSMRTASAGFSVFGFGGGGSYSGSTSSTVVSMSYIHTAVNVNMTWTATYNNQQGHYLYQWLWTVVFPEQTVGNPCTQPSFQIGTAKIVQADITPRCLPGANLDAKYTQCFPEGALW